MTGPTQPRPTIRASLSNAWRTVTARVPRFFNSPNADRIIPAKETIDAPDNVSWQRIIASDPREMWYLALPAKLLPRQVEQIKRAGLGGDLWQQWQLESLMADSWPMYRKCAHELKQTVAGSRWIVRPYCVEGEEPTKSAVEKATLVQTAITSMRPDRFTDEVGFRGMIYQLCDAVLSGISMVEIQWYNKNGAILPRAASWVHPRHYTFNDAGRLTIIGQESVSDVLALNQPKQGIKMTPAQLDQIFLVGQYNSRAGSSLAGGLMRPLATWWSYWIYGREWIAVMAQKHGTPFLWANYQTGMASTPELQRLEGYLRDAAANNYALIPQGSELKVEAAKSLGADNPIVFLMKQADEAPQYLLLGQTATTQGTAGALGNETARSEVKKENIEALSEWVGSVITEQLVEAILTKNYGNADERPTVEADFTEVSNPEEQARRWSLLTGMNMPPVLKSEFYKENSLTEPKPGDEVIKDGKVTIAEEAKTEQEHFEEQLEREAQTAEVQQELSGGIEAAEPVKINVVKAGGTSEGARKGWLKKHQAAIALSEAAQSSDKAEDHQKAYEAHKLAWQRGDDYNHKTQTHYTAMVNHKAQAEFLAKNGDKYHQVEHHKAINVALKTLKASEMTLRDALALATEPELKQLEAMVTAAETAPHRNGEVKAVEEELDRIIKNPRIKL